MVAQYIATQPIMDLCEQSDRRTGARLSLRWWEQARIDLEGAKKKGGRGNYGFRVGFGVGRRGVKWSEWVEWSGVEWSGRVNVPITTTVQNRGRETKYQNNIKRERV